MENDSKIRVLIVDDSAVVRQTLAEILSSDPEIEVIGTAGDPFVAAERIAEQVPDVITLDIEMPRMDGLTFLKKIMSQHPIPVVICSSLAEEGAQSTLRALEYGAVDIITKPKLGTKQFLEDSRIVLCQSVKAAAAARLRPLGPMHTVEPKLTADAVLVSGHRTPWRKPRRKSSSWARPRAEPRRSEHCSKRCPPIRPASSSCSTCRSCSRAPLPTASTASAPSPSRRPKPTTRSSADAR